MSSEVFTVYDDAGRSLTVTRLAGPASLGANRTCYQLTIGDAFVTFTAAQFGRIAGSLLTECERAARRRTG